MDGIKIIRNQLNDMFLNMDLRSFSTRKQKTEYIVKLTFKNGGHCGVVDNYLDYSFRRKKPSEVKRSYLRKEKYLKELESKLNNVYKVEEELLDFEELFGIDYANVSGHEDEYVAAGELVCIENLQGAVECTHYIPRIEIAEKFQSVSYNEYHELNFTEQLSVIYEEVAQCDRRSLGDYNRPACTAIEGEETEYCLLYTSPSPRDA